MHQSYCMRYTVVSGVVLASAFRARSQPVDQLISFRFQKKKKCSEKKMKRFYLLCPALTWSYARARFVGWGDVSIYVIEPRANDYCIGMRRTLFCKPNRDKSSKTREIDTKRRLRCRAAGERRHRERRGCIII